jgi:hypothetical protein
MNAVTLPEPIPAPALSPALASVPLNERTFPVIVSRLAGVVAALEQLAKRATKKRLTPVAWTVGKAYVSREHVDSKHACDGLRCEGCADVPRVPVTLVGEPPRHAGWTFVAALQHLDGENVVRAVPGESPPTLYRTRGAVCDHCKAVRRRHDTFVLRHDDGRHVQVGSTCVADFLGGVSEADKLAAEASLLAQARGLAEGGCEDSAGGYGASSGDSMLSSYLPIVAWCVEVQGWTSRTQAREQGREHGATADLAWTYLGSKRLADEAGVVVTEAHVALAAAAESWAENLTDAQVDQERGDYLHNLRAVARTGLVSHRTAGIAASMVTAYQRALGAERKRAERAARPASEYVGTVGQRQTFAVTLDFVTGYDTAYGYTTVLKFVTEAGAAIVWKASSTDLGRGDVGKRYLLKGTVKSHEERKGVKETLVLRCRVESLEGASTPAG